jgi:hypothetical protein
MYLNVKAFPNSQESSIEEERNGDLIIRLKSSPQKDHANKELISLVSNYFQVAKKYIHIVKGKTNKHKTLFIEEE